MESLKPWLRSLRQHLLTGVSYAIPFIACGGILIAAALAFAPAGASGAPDPSLKDSTGAFQTPVLNYMHTVGVAAFRLMLPILAGYIAFSVAGKPGQVAGAIGGLLADDIKSGFLGALVAGLLAGYVVHALKKTPTNKYTKPLMPILVIPIVSCLLVGAAMLLVLGPPIAEFNAYLGRELKDMQTGNAVLLALLLGGMIAFDMGGPVNKAAFFFAAGMLKEGNASVMGAVAAAICTPPLGMGLATLVRRSTWSEQEREAGYAAMGMGMIGITEGAIPFAAGDPLRVIPSIMAGSMTAASIAMAAGVKDHAPHGGPIVLPVVDNRVMYVVAIIAGMIVTATVAHGLRAIRKDGSVRA